MIDPRSVQLGKKAPRIDRRTLKLSRYLNTTIPPAPMNESWIRKIRDWPMYLNDTLGDCVIAAMAHMVQQWTFYAKGQIVIPTNDQVLRSYEAIGGYIPGDDSTDNGCDMLTALNYWRKTGLAGHKIIAYVSVNPKNITEVQQAVWLFGNLFMGLQLPITAQNPVEGNKWTVKARLTGDGSPGSWGGHCVPVMASSPYIHSCVTWGQVMRMTSNFRLAYCDELYAVLSHDWIAKTLAAPSGFNVDQLMGDLQQIT